MARATSSKKGGGNAAGDQNTSGIDTRDGGGATISSADPLANPLPVLLDAPVLPLTRANVEGITAADEPDPRTTMEYYLGRSGSPTRTEIDEILSLEALCNEHGALPALAQDACENEIEEQTGSLPPATSARSMRRQTLHTWSSTPRTEIVRNGANVNASASVLATASGLSGGAAGAANTASGAREGGLTDGGQRALRAAPSQGDIFAEVGASEMPKKKETVADVRLRMDENCAKIILAFCEFKDKQLEVNKEILKRLCDTNDAVAAFQERLTAASSGGVGISTATQPEVICMQQELRTLRAAAETQHQTTGLLTSRANALVNVPNQLATLDAQLTASSRATQELAVQVGTLSRRMEADAARRGEATQASSTNLKSTTATQELTSQVAALNRQLAAGGATTAVQHHSSQVAAAIAPPAYAPSPVDAAIALATSRGTKRAREDSDDEDVGGPNYWDVLIFPVHPSKGATPLQIGRTILSELRVDSSAMRSAMRPGYLKRKDIISLRFHEQTPARTLLDRLNTNPPIKYAHLQARTPSAYAKRRDDSEEDVRTSQGGKARCLNILFWNIHGGLAVKITDAEIIKLILNNDVTVFQETFLRTGEENTLRLPRGYEIVASSRKDISYTDPRGGVAIVIAPHVHYKLCEQLCGPELLVLDLDHLFLIGGYLLPDGSNWQDFTDVHPTIRFREALSACSSCPDKPVLAGGDMNARIACRMAKDDHLPRSSLDGNPKAVNSRGCWLLRACKDTDMYILNGTIKEASSPGSFTSFQGMGSSVIDLVLASPGLLPRIQDGALKVLPHLCVLPDQLSDHAILSISIDVPDARPIRDVAPLAKRQRGPIPIANPSKLLYGFATPSMRVRSVHLATSQKGKSRAAFALYWGLGCTRNRAYSFAGQQSSSRAALCGVLAAVRECPLDETLTIYTPSLYAIRTFCYWAGMSAVRGWDCLHGDIIAACAAEIRARTAVIEFRLAKEEESVLPLAAARKLAKEGRMAFDTEPHESSSARAQVLQYQGAGNEAGPSTPRRRKVWTSVPEADLPRSKPCELTLEECVDPDNTHRGRRRERELLRDNLNKFVAAACDGPREYWDVIRGWTDDRRIPPAVTPRQLHESFRRRLNPPETLPDFFEADGYRTVRQLFESIPVRTVDRSPRGFFSRKITVGDIARMKKKLRSRSLRSSVGVDDLSYAKILSIPNENLVELFQTCIDDCDAPQHWLITILVGILKRGKAVDDPESYRLVGLECCLLKMLTWLFDERLREWSDSVGAVPESQSGFRPGRRTQDNVFILTTAIARARAEGKTLYVFYGDMTNAFPYTDLPILWTQLYAAGVAGPFFDWMRMVYARMVYATRHADDCEGFKSLIGLLTGDSASPGLWNIFFGDYRVPSHPEDIELNGRRVCQVEEADDNALFTTAFRPFQEKVSYYWNYCGWKHVYASVPKSKWQIYGPLPRVIPTLMLGDHAVELVAEFKFLGLWLSSVTANIFARNYAVTASKARNAAFAAFALKHWVGTIPVKEGLTLYTARVDCYLILGAEVCVDTDRARVQDYISVQHEYLRRLLGLSSRSVLAPLFSETGLMPIRIRRLVLALGRLRYMLSLDNTRVVRDALMDAIDGFAHGRSSWVGDIAIVLSSLPTPIIVRPEDFRNLETVERILATVHAAVDHDVQSTVEASPHLPLLHHRLELKDDKLTTVARRLRHYLTLVQVPNHRKCLTRLVFGEHCLSVARLRFSTKTHYPVPRGDCVCRLCLSAVEDEVHALLECNGNERLVTLRASFMEEIMSEEPLLAVEFATQEPIDFLRRVLASRKVVRSLGKFVGEVVAIFERFAVVVPDKYRK